MSKRQEPPEASDGPGPEPPESVRFEHADWNWSVAWAYYPRSITWRLEGPDGELRFLKVIRRSAKIPSLEGECQRMRWARDYLPVPDVIGCGADDNIEWLLTAALPGRDATWDEFKSDKLRLVGILARGLRRFHAAPSKGCPFDYTVETALELVRARVVSGLVDPDKDFHREHCHLTAQSAIDELERLRPESEDLVVCHGDYCLPNVLIEGAEAVGFLDLGQLGVADRWWDIAVGSWSVTWNLGPRLENHFYQSYGVEPDLRRIAFYRLLYDLSL